MSIVHQEYYNQPENWMEVAFHRWRMSIYAPFGRTVFWYYNLTTGVWFRCIVIEFVYFVKNVGLKFTSSPHQNLCGGLQLNQMY